jgi:hypothetical protein
MRKVPDKSSLRAGSTCQSNWLASWANIYSELCLPTDASDLAIFIHAFSTHVNTLLCGTRNRAASKGTPREPWGSCSGNREPLMADKVLRMSSH